MRAWRTPEDSSAPVVLIVDDDTSYRACLREHFEGAGLTVAEASSGEGAIAATRREVPAVVTLDWIMPRLSGLQVCRALRDDIALVGTPVVFITVLDDPRDRAIARRCGADSFVCKSAGAAAIVDVVRRLAAEGRSFADSPRGALRAR